MAIATRALACFGDRELTLEGTLDCLDYSSTSYAPAEFKWLCCLVPFGASPGRLLTGFAFYRKSATESEQGMAVRITGHYDDPAAPAFAESVGPYVDLTAPEVVLLGVRASFVAIEITPTSAP